MSQLLQETQDLHITSKNQQAFMGINSIFSSTMHPVD